MCKTCRPLINVPDLSAEQATENLQNANLYILQNRKHLRLKAEYLERNIYIKLVDIDASGKELFRCMAGETQLSERPSPSLSGILSELFPGLRDQFSKNSI
ncbi:hypothetical protein AGMMS50249_1900 [candidate division SR1 bacterium]|nr:hypothetical protein AGMMS50249_1900 [candidate division SR1 bacterium]